jgi:hypothetical protein
MIKRAAIVMLTVLAFVVCAFAQDASAPPRPQVNDFPSHQEKSPKLASNSSIFIYRSQSDPCAAPPHDEKLFLLGSGFVTGVEKKGGSTPQSWHGWKFLVTAKHVLAKQNDITIRVNAMGESRLICQKINLRPKGETQNVYLAPAGVDLAAVLLPEIPGTDLAIVSPSLLMDGAKQKEWSIGVGTQVFTLGYLYAYSGQHLNIPVTKFGHISRLADETWYFNPLSRLMEQGYVLDLSSTPGLSGAPVFTYGVDFGTNPSRYRESPPYLVGVVKGLILVPVNGQWISQGIAVIEPSANLKALLRQIATMLKKKGAEVIGID